MKTQFQCATCVAVLCIVLTLGLWPFHAPRNGVAWLGNRNGLRFGTWSTVIGTGAFPTGVESGASGSIEVWLQPRRIWDASTLLAFYTPGYPSHFSLRQSEAGLELHTRTTDAPQCLYVRDGIRRSGRMFLTIAFGPHVTAIYTNGVLVKAAPQFRLSANALTGRLVLGDSPGQPDNWSGQLLGLAIYRRELTAAQVLRHYETWTRGEQPDLSNDEEIAALYLFNERGGNVVHNLVRSDVDLYIPEKYAVEDKIVLEPFWREFSTSRSYWDAAFKNVVGFIPLGFCFVSFR